MLSQIALLLVLICITSAPLPPVRPKANKNISGKHQGNVTISMPIFGGKLFGTVGNSEKGLFEETGYKKLIFNDHRGKLDGQVYQKTVMKHLGVSGIKSDVGAKLHWSKNSANVDVKLSKPMPGNNSTVTVKGAGHFNLKKDTEVFIKKLDATFILRKKKTKAN